MRRCLPNPHVWKTVVCESFFKTKNCVPWKKRLVSLPRKQSSTCLSQGQPSLCTLQEKRFMHTSYFVQKNIKNRCTRGWYVIKVTTFHASPETFLRKPTCLFSYLEGGGYSLGLCHPDSWYTHPWCGFS